MASVNENVIMLCEPGFGRSATRKPLTIVKLKGDRPAQMTVNGNFVSMVY